MNASLDGRVYHTIFGHCDHLAFRIIMSGAYLKYYLKFDVWVHLGRMECLVLFMGHCDLKLDLLPLVFRIIMSGAYFLYFLR